jgi:hypothetical protein
LPFFSPEEQQQVLENAVINCDLMTPKPEEYLATEYDEEISDNDFWEFHSPDYHTFINFYLNDYF